MYSPLATEDIVRRFGTLSSAEEFTNCGDASSCRRRFIPKNHCEFPGKMSDADSDGPNDTSSVLERMLLDSFEASSQGSPSRPSRSVSHTPVNNGGMRGATPKSTVKSPELPRNISHDLHEK